AHNLIDELSYDDGGDWPTEPDGSGSSLELINPEFDNSLGTNWAGSVDADSLFGTPLAQNSVYSAGNQPPAITNIVNVPGDPTTSDPVEVSAIITDLSLTMSVAGADLYYDAGSGYTSVVMANTVDSFYATIPAQGEGATVYYYITAWDDQNDTTVSGTNSYYVTDFQPEFGDIIFNEILYDPAIEPDEEWIEFYNTHPTSTFLMDDYTIRDGSTWICTLPAGTSIGPLSYLVISNDTAAFRTLYGWNAGVVEAATPYLNNSGDNMRLYTSGGSTVDSVFYSDDAPWPDSDGTRSIELKNETFDRNNGNNWALSDSTYGTPMAQNSVYTSGNQPPSIANIVHTPAEPTTTDPVEVSATILDLSFTDAVTGADLYYDTGSGYTSVAMANTADSFYATIPAQGEGTFVDYYISAMDHIGDSTVSATNAYYVSDTGPTIYDVQYTETMGWPSECYPSDFEDIHVTVTGIVTGVRYGSQPRFYIQDPNFDDWCGLYISDILISPSLGDEISITGDIVEYYTFTDMYGVTGHTIVSTGNALPDPEYVTTAFIGHDSCGQDPESLEGMLVELHDVEVIQGPNGYNVCQVQDASGDWCQIDDESWKYGDPSIKPDPQPDSGMVYTKIIGILHYNYGEYTIMPRDKDDYYPAAPAIEIGVTHDGGTEQAGHRMWYEGSLTNTSANPITTDVWVMIGYNGGTQESGPWSNWLSITVAGNTTDVWPNVYQWIPRYVPAGDYSLIARCGDYGTLNHVSEASFDFSVLAYLGGSSPDYGWEYSSGWGDDVPENMIPTEFALRGNYPNPFNAETNIVFDLPTAGHVSLDVYNLMGQKVASIVNSEMQAGFHSVNWDASAISSGIYFYKLTAGDKVATKKMQLLK
ncbi:MAG: T9SS type A sorting domain-containing protein, partial [candidate division Zixibacteria bacterium]|nr:T9SS type A sorting domain-containing protein [candidate division Zixibacteria bacterium]